MYNKSNIIMHDKIVKKLFTSTHDDIGKRLCARIIAALLDEDETDIYNNIEFIHPNIQANINYPNNEADTVLTDNGTIWNFEYNLNYSDRLHIKNTIYLTQLFLRQLPTMKEIDNIKKVIRVDFDNYDFFGENEFLYHCQMMDTKYHKIENNYISTYHFNLHKLNNMSYNEAKESTSLLEKYLYFLVNDNKDLDTFYKGDELMEKIMKEVDYLSREKDAILFYDSDELYRLARLDAIKEGKEEGIKEGLEEGRQEGIKEGKRENSRNIAKKMLSHNLSIDIISEITGLEIDEINNIKSQD